LLFFTIYSVSVNIKQQKHQKNERLINLRVIRLLEYAQIPKSIGDIFAYFSKKESNNEENCDFSDPYSGFWESSVTVSSLQVLLFSHIMDCRNHLRVSKLCQISLRDRRTLHVSRYSYAFLAQPFS
jgi:hypothetical protein